MNSQDIDELMAMLPEYVNGTLSVTNTKRMEKAIKESLQLKAFYAEEKRLLERVNNGVDAMVDESKQSEESRLAALLEKAQLDENLKQKDTQSDTQKSTLKNALSLLNPKRWHPAVALSLALAIPAQAAIIGGQAATIASLEDENFRLASGPCKDAKTQNNILIEFTENANWQEIAQLLDKQQLVIIKRGSFGALSVRSKSEGDALDTQIRLLQSSPLIVSAEAME